MTSIILKLLPYQDEKLIARSQAKRILEEVKSFKSICFDFAGIKEIGPAFADELFRVYKNNHSDKKIEFINSNEYVSKMILRTMEDKI